MFQPNAVDNYIRINPDTKLFEPVWEKRDILSYWLGPDPSHNSGPTTIAAGNSATVPFKLPHSSLDMDNGGVGNALEIDQIVASAPNFTNSALPFTIFLTDMGDQRQYMNFPVHICTFVGSGQLSARLAENLLLPTRHQLMAALTSIDTDGSADLSLFFIGKLYDIWSSNLQKYPVDHAEMLKKINKLLERRKYVTPYWMTTDQGVVIVPANQTVDIDTPVGSEGHFECTHILRSFNSGNQTTSPFELEIINPQTRQSLMNGKIHSYMIGDALNPQPFPAPFIVPAGQTIRFRIKDLSGAKNTIYLTLRGMKIRAPFKSRAEVEKEFGMPSKQHKTNERHQEMKGA